MAWQLDLYIVILICGAVVAGAVTVAAWKRPVAAGGRDLAVLMTAVFGWCVAAALEAAAADVPVKILLSKVEYLGIASSPLLLLFFALGYSRSTDWLTHVRRALLWAIPVTTLALALTNEWHHLIWTGFSLAKAAGARLLIYDHGPFFWVHVAYSYALMSIAGILVLKAYFRAGGLQRRQALALLLALPWPWLGNLAYLAGLTAPAGHDLTPLGFAIAGLFLLWGMYRLQLADLIPVAREKVIESMGESLIVLDELGRVAAMNPSARALLSEMAVPDGAGRPGRVVGSPAGVLFAPWPELADTLAHPSAGRKELTWEGGEGAKFYNVRLSPLAGGSRGASAWVAVLTDITRLKQAETAAVRARRVAETLREAGLALSSTFDLREMSRLILLLMQRVIAFDAGAFLVSDAGELRLAALRGFSGESGILGQTFPVAGCRLCNLVVQHQRPLIMESIRREDLLVPLPADLDVRSYLGVPIVFQGNVTGLLALYGRRPGHFSAEDIPVAESFANQAAIALQNARLFDQMSALAVTDNLTGLSNRRGFFELAGKEVERADRYARPLCLVMFDIDDFKRVNDTHGHLVGDQVLRVLAATVKKTTRTTDTVCRYGGDEFLVLMPETTLDQALTTAERLRQKISTEMVVVTAAGQLSLTISLGVVALSGQGKETVERLVQRADEAMYQAKAAGKNCVRG
ncbi:MAG TPA: histidine kinase N-terminal 7TM domain-containing protein [Terriglobales bacterium]|nr:histidine kinase N-terminal 7TM domain-containing protein [Terriglobales bacterium]